MNITLIPIEETHIMADFLLGKLQRQGYISTRMAGMSGHLPELCQMAAEKASLECDKPCIAIVLIEHQNKAVVLSRDCDDCVTIPGHGTFFKSRGVIIFNVTPSYCGAIRVTTDNWGKGALTDYYTDKRVKFSPGEFFCG